jgi:hypothetical protein
MTHRPPVNVAASVFERLKQRARRTGEDFNLLLDRYVAERLLYRLSQSSHAGAFTLKGATLFAVWEDEPHRATRDIDLLGSAAQSAERLQSVFADVCAVPVVDDGLVFDPLSATVNDIRVGEGFGGERVIVSCRLGNARLQLQIDIGFGDTLAHPGEPVALPTLLDFPAPRLRVYPVDSVIAEKLHAMAEHGMLNSRMKDIYDVCALAQRLEFDGARLTDAVRATFEHRGRGIGEVPAPLTPAFVADVAVNLRWQAFLRRSRLEPLDLAAAVDRLGAFLLEPLAALAAGGAFAERWPPGGPWQ